MTDPTTEPTEIAAPPADTTTPQVQPQPTLDEASARSVRISRILLLLILLIGAGLRLYRLDKNPPGLLADEASMGCNAVSLYYSGKDLSGKPWPLYSRLDSVLGIVGIFANPVFQYSLIPMVRIFGLTIWGIRLTAVVYGLLGILAAYWLGKTILDRRLGLLTAFLLATSSWHIHFSRIGFEAISMPFFVTMGTVCLLKGFRKGYWFLPAALFYATSLYCYSTAKVFVPLLLLGALGIGIRFVFRQWVWSILATILLVYLAIPGIKSQLAGGDTETRTKASLIFGTGITGELGFQYLQERKDAPGYRWILAHPKTIPWFVFVYNYRRYLSPDYLFRNGDGAPRHCVPGFGMAHAFYLPLFLIGLEFLLWNWRRPAHRLLLWWLLIYPIAPSLATGSPHGIRSINLLPALDLIAAIGAWSLLSYIGSWKPRILFFNRKGRVALILLIGVTIFGIYRFAQYLKAYYMNYEMVQGAMWQGGMREPFEEIARIKSKYDKVYVSSNIPNSYLFAMIFGGVDPSKIDFGKNHSQQLNPFGYYVYTDPPPETLTERDLVLMPVWEYTYKFSRFTIIGKFSELSEGGPISFLLVQGIPKVVLPLADGYEQLLEAPEKIIAYPGFEPPAELMLTRLGMSKEGRPLRWLSGAPTPEQVGYGLAVSFGGVGLKCRLSMNGTPVLDFEPRPGKQKWSGNGWTADFSYLGGDTGHHGIMVIRPDEGVLLPTTPAEWSLEILEAEDDRDWFGVRNIRQAGLLAD